METTPSPELENKALETLRKNGQKAVFAVRFHYAPGSGYAEHGWERSFKARLTAPERDWLVGELEINKKEGMVSEFSVLLLNEEVCFDMEMCRMVIGVMDMARVARSSQELRIERLRNQQIMMYRRP